MAKTLTEQVGEIKEPLSQFTEQTAILLDANKKLHDVEKFIIKKVCII